MMGLIRNTFHDIFVRMWVKTVNILNISLILADLWLILAYFSILFLKFSIFLGKIASFEAYSS